MVTTKRGRRVAVKEIMNPEVQPTGTAKQTLFGDIQDPRLMYLKAALFFVAGLMCAVALFVQNPTPTTALILVVGIWSFCRLYYFAFYVIEKYIDPSFKFA